MILINLFSFGVPKHVPQLGNPFGFPAFLIDPTTLVYSESLNCAKKYVLSKLGFPVQYL